MNLSKAMRKYSNTLLMIFMSILLVAFLLPPNMFSGGQGGPGAIELGTAFGQPVYSTDVQRAGNAYRLAQAARMAMLPFPLDELDVCLLVREAEQAGITVGPDYVAAQLDTEQNPAAAQMVARLQQRYGISRDDLFAQIGKWMAVDHLARQQLEATGVSAARLEAMYALESQEADVTASVITAEGLLHNVPEPSEEQLQAFYEEARNRDPNHTADGLQFGYLQPPKVKVEYLTVDAQQLRDDIRVREREAREQYEQDPTRYQTPDMNAPRLDDGRPPMRQLTFEEAEERVKSDLRLVRAREAAQRAVNDMHAELIAPWLGSRQDDAGFREAPPADQQVDFARMKEEFSRTVPVTLVQTDWLTPTDLARSPIGRAQHRVSNRETMTAAQLAFRVPGLFEPGEDPETRRGMLNVMEPSPVLITRAFNMQTRQMDGAPTQAFIMRVVDVKPAGPPESLDVVRDQVVEDWKLTQAYALAEEQARLLADTAREAGLASACGQAEVLRSMLTLSADPTGARLAPDAMDPRTRDNMQDLGPSKVTPFTRIRQQIRTVGSLPDLAEEVFAMDDPASADQADKIFVAPAPDQQAWVIAEVREILPLYEGDFEQVKPQISQQLAGFQQRTVIQLWFASPYVRERTNWQPFEPTAQ